MAAVVTLDSETAIRTRINDHYDFLNLPYGRMIVNAHDPCLEVNMQENIKEIEGLMKFAHGTVLDVGANVGSHAINFAQVADYVYAFEPHPVTYLNLCANILLHQAWNVLPFQYALGNRSGSTTVWNLDQTKPNTGMGVMVEHGDLVVPMRTIDELELSPLSFIKIDVEGYEYEVVLGAQETLKRESLIVFVELHLNELIEPIRTLMTELGYRNFEYVHTLYDATDEKTGYVFTGAGVTYGFLFWKPERIKFIDVKDVV